MSSKMATLDVELIPKLRIPHLSQFGGVWAIEEKRFEAEIARVRMMDIAAHVAAARDEDDEPWATSYTVDADGIAHLRVEGVITKYGSSITGGGAVAYRKALRDAVTRADVRGVMLSVDSPGGTVAGVGDLADEVAANAKKKPIAVYIEDLGASAAYFVASQGTFISANEHALVGSIGVYTTVDDWSGFFATRGVKRHVIRSGRYKGAGVLGTEVTGEQLADMQRVVDGIHAIFAAAVGRGRKMTEEQVATVADGRIWGAAKAKELGLIDQVENAEAARSRLLTIVGSRRSKAGAPTKETRMSQTTNTGEGAASAAATETPVAQKAATIAELRAALPKSTAEFREECLMKGLTVAEATVSWLGKVEEQLATARQEVEAAKQAAAKPGARAVGTGSTTSSSDDPIAAWNAAVAAGVKTGMSRAAAIRAVVIEQPDLHADYLEAYNRANAHLRRNSKVA